MPLAVGVPLIVMVLLAQAAVTPAGRPVAVPMPVAPVVVCVILVKAELIHSVGVDEGVPAVFTVGLGFPCQLLVEPVKIKLDKVPSLFVIVRSSKLVSPVLIPPAVAEA